MHAVRLGILLTLVLPVLWMLGGSVRSAVAATPVGAILGGSVYVPPITTSLLCNGTAVILDCPQYFNPDWPDITGLRFFGITNRVNPGRCVKSVNGGSVWELCDVGTVSPFTGVLDSFGANFAVAANGALLAAGDQGTNNCIIRRSTDYGVSWSTVFTDSTTVNVSCAIAFGNPTPNTLRCANASSYCVMIAFIAGTFDLVAYWSNDYGVSWTKGTAFNIVSGDAQISVSVAGDGNSGSLTRHAISYNTASVAFASTGGGDWTRNGVIPTPPGAGTGSRCASGAMIFSGQSVVCGPDPTLTTTYHFFTHGAGSTSNMANFIPQNGLTNTQSPDFMAVGVGGGRAYIIGRNAANTQIIIWMTTDTFSSAIQVATITPTSALIGGAPKGDAFLHNNGKIYFTSGAPADKAFFGVIQ